MKAPGLVVFVLAGLLAGLGACSTTPPGSSPGAPEAAQKPPARYNLAGYPPPFRDGFNAGCEAAKRNTTTPVDKARYGSDTQYKAGWKDGQSVCKAK